MAQSTVHDFATSPPLAASTGTWNAGSVAVSVVAILTCVVIFAIHGFGATVWGLLTAVAVLFATALMHARFLSAAREEHRQTHDLLLSKEREFRSVFENTLDAILIFDNNGVCLGANPSCLALIGAQPSRMVGQPIRLFYSNPREFDSFWQQLLVRQRFQGESELVRTDGVTVFAEFTASRHFLPNRHLLVLRDVTQRHRAQQAVTQSLVVARSSWQEADALRRATLALTENLRMDQILDTLLETLARFVPYEHAQLLLLESGLRLFVAREASNENSVAELGFPETFEMSEFPILRKVFEHPEGLIVDDATLGVNGRPVGSESRVRSWIGVPIASSTQVLGVLSLAHSSPARFASDHLRLTRSLATSAAVAIQNARLYERAEIYGMELERRISEVQEVRLTKEEPEEKHGPSGKWFEEVFRSAPVAIAVTSLAEGRYLEVNKAFEHRFGLNRNDLLGRTLADLGFWENPQEPTELIDRLRRGAKVRGETARVRSRSGGYQATVYSAELIHLDGRPSLLVATDDLPNRPPSDKQT